MKTNNNPTVRIHNGRTLYQFTPQQLEDIKNAKITTNVGHHSGQHPLSTNGMQFGNVSSGKKVTVNFKGEAI